MIRGREAGMADMDKLKSSYYNFIIDQKDQGYILYNSLSGVIISVTDHEELEIFKLICICPG